MTDNIDVVESLKENGKSGNKVYFKDFIVVGSGRVISEIPAFSIIIM